MPEQSPDGNLIPNRIAGHALRRRDYVAFQYISRPDAVAQQLTWGQLWQRACRTAAAIASKDLSGRRIGIACEQPIDFVVALSACLISGGVAVPMPAALSRRSLPRLRSIIEHARPTAILVSGGSKIGERIVPPCGESLAIIHVEEAGASHPPAGAAPDPTGLAIIQFSSGSTGSPKGVGLSHCNLAANCAAIAQAYGLSSSTRGLSWLPLHHDMGLVGHILVPMWLGCQSTLCDPLRFLQRPLTWLQMITRERATITSAPNFAYEMCVRAANQSGVRELDLSSLTTAVCGGEPVLEATIRRFIDTFGEAGFSASAMAPSYGLAEATLLVASGKADGGPKFVNPRKIGLRGSIRLDVPVTALGKPVSGMQVRIVDSEGGELDRGVLGEVEISGSSLGAVVTADGAVMAIDTLRTGDFGFLSGDDLFLTGRKKELIIIRGQNIHAADVESAALNCDLAVVPGGVAALGITQHGTEQLVLIAEVDRRRRRSEVDLSELKSIVSAAVAEASGAVPSDVVLAPLGSLPRTSSGKIQRSAAAQMYRTGVIARLIGRPRKKETADVAS
jgi:acyl-CoA synthetase (AMP-forming)/AMP-acid ligase II